MTQDAAGLAGAARAPQVAAIILAAGLSARTAPRHKLLTRDAEGRTMIARVTQNALASDASDVVVVTGYRGEDIAAAASEAIGGASRLRFVHCARFQDGMSASIGAGVGAISAQAALICLADMPLVSAAILNRLIGAFGAAETPAILIPACGGVPGNPVLWSAAFYPALGSLTGDRGGRDLLRRQSKFCRVVETGDPAVLTDLDDGYAPLRPA